MYYKDTDCVHRFNKFMSSVSAVTVGPEVAQDTLEAIVSAAHDVSSRVVTPR